MPTIEHIILKRVDTKLLDRQRRCLTKVIDTVRAGKKVPPSAVKLLEGLENMLEEWSDDRHFKREPKLFLGECDTGSFTFHSLADSDDAARSLVVNGYRLHAKQYQARNQHLEPMDVRVHEISLGECLRDGTPITNKSCRTTSKRKPRSLGTSGTR